MLNIYYGEYKEANYIFDPDMFFNHRYDPDWFNEELVKEMILDVDRSVVKGGYLIESPVLGPIPPERLSGGVKTLIMILHDQEHVFNASACGDNCAKWLLKLGEDRDITVRLGYLMDFGKDPFEIKGLNTGVIAHNLRELDDEVIDNRLLQEE